MNNMSENFAKTIYKGCRKDSGITMVALVFTILIIIVLTGIGLYFIVGQNSILDKSNTAAKESNLAMLKEKLQMKISSWKIDSLAGDIWVTKMKEYVAQDSELSMVIYYDNLSTGEISKNPQYVKVTFTDYPNYVATVDSKLNVTLIEEIQNYGSKQEDGYNVLYLSKGQQTENTANANINFFPMESIKNNVKMYYKIGERINEWTETTTNSNSVTIKYDDITPYIINADKSITFVAQMINTDGQVLAYGEIRIPTTSNVEMSDGSPDAEQDKTTGTVTFSNVQTNSTGSSLTINYDTNTYLSLINCYYKIGTNTTEWVKATSQSQSLQIDYSKLDTRAVDSNNQVVIYAKMALKTNGNLLDLKSQSVTYYSFSASTTDKFTDGTGTAVDPYLIENAQQLNAVRNNLGATYKIIKDIDLSSYTEWTPIGTSSAPFTGVIDGYGHYVINVNVSNGGDNTGLFGYNTGTIKNVKLNNVNITGGTNVGGIVGYNTGNVISTTTNGTISGTTNVGGTVRIYNRCFIRKYFFFRCKRSSRCWWCSSAMFMQIIKI